MTTNKKRAPKASTMTAKRWEPCETRTKELWVRDGKSLKDLRAIINREFDLTATERQYKVHLQHMKLERNVKREGQRKIIQQIALRKQVGKETHRLWVRHHKISQERLSRWEKELNHDAGPGYLSPLSSCMTVLTRSPTRSPITISPDLSKDQGRESGVPDNRVMENKALKRPLKDSAMPEIISVMERSRDLFADTQHIVQNSDYVAWNPNDKHHLERSLWVPWVKSCPQKYRWDSKVKNDLTQLRNLMQASSEPLAERRLHVLPRAVRAIFSRMAYDPQSRCMAYFTCREQRVRSWTTSFGQINAAFHTLPSDSHLDVSGASRARQGFIGETIVIPKDLNISSSCVVFKFEFKEATLNLSARLTYFRMVPNASKVFSIIREGDVSELVELIITGYASLNDRDEQGRSLLNYAAYFGRNDLSKYLIENGADVNATEADMHGFLGPVHRNVSFIPCEAENHDKLVVQTSIFKIMLDAGADLSVESDEGMGSLSTFRRALAHCSLGAFKGVLNQHVFAVDVNAFERSDQDWKTPPLTELAFCSEYDPSDAFYILGKTVLLLERKANVDCRGACGNTVLHTVLMSGRRHENSPKDVERAERCLWSWKLSIITPKDMLILFMSAGADVFEFNVFGETPSMVAARCRRVTEWTEALTVCGYDPEEGKMHGHRDFEGCTQGHARPKLAFKGCCRRLRARKLPPEGCAYDHLWEDVVIQESDRGHTEKECNMDGAASRCVEVSSENKGSVNGYKSSENDAWRPVDETQSLYGDVDAGFWYAIPHRSREFIGYTEQETEILKPVFDNDMDGSIVSQNSPSTNNFMAKGSHGRRGGELTVLDDTSGFDELMLDDMDTMNFFDFGAYSQSFV